MDKENLNFFSQCMKSKDDNDNYKSQGCEGPGWVGKNEKGQVGKVGKDGKVRIERYGRLGRFGR